MRIGTARSEERERGKGRRGKEPFLWSRARRVRTRKVKGGSKRGAASSFLPSPSRSVSLALSSHPKNGFFTCRLWSRSPSQLGPQPAVRPAQLPRVQLDRVVLFQPLPRRDPTAKPQGLPSTLPFAGQPRTSDRNPSPGQAVLRWGRRGRQDLSLDRLLGEQVPHRTSWEAKEGNERMAELICHAGLRADCL